MREGRDLGCNWSQVVLGSCHSWNGTFTGAASGILRSRPPLKLGNKSKMSNIPKTALDRIEARFELGKIDHADDYYKKYLDSGELTTRNLLRSRWGNALKHLRRTVNSVNQQDDNLAAVAWFCIIAMEAEELFGKSVNEIINDI